MRPQDFVQHLVAGLEPSSAQRYLAELKALDDIAGRPICDPIPTPDEVSLWMAKRAVRCRNMAAAIFRRLIKAGIAFDEIDFAQAWQLQAATEGHHKRGKSSARGVSEPEAARIAAAFRSYGGPIAMRDAAVMCSLALGVDRRRVVELDRSDYLPGIEQPRRSVLRTYNGHKKRHNVIVTEAASVLDGWCNQRGDEPGPLFTYLGRELTKDLSKPMSSQAVWDGLRRVCDRADIRKLTVWDLRITDRPTVQLISEEVVR